jgi:predicted oxidoreductase
MNHRHLGQSGLVVSEISYGNWITHASQIEKATAIACVRAALQERITTFDTAAMRLRLLRPIVAGAIEKQREMVKNIPA